MGAYGGPALWPPGENLPATNASGGVIPTLAAVRSG